MRRARGPAGPGAWQESTNKAVVADLYLGAPAAGQDSPTAAAFAAVAFSSGAAGAAGYFAFPRLPRAADAALVAGAAAAAVALHLVSVACCGGSQAPPADAGEEGGGV